MEKQIEEMARDLENHTCMSQFQAEIASRMLYQLGYRKQGEKYLIKENGDILPLTHHSEWISVEDRLPENGGMYLVYNPQRAVSKVVTARYSVESQRWCGADACCYHEGITNWMQLPEPPETKGGAE